MDTVTLPSEQLYTDGRYAVLHPDWDLPDTPGKAQELWPGLIAVLDAMNKTSLRIADVGAGSGGVLAELGKLFESRRPDVKVQSVGFEIAPHAIALAREKFPQLDMRQKYFEVSDGPFDVVLFVDVLEHLENPREMLRTARAAARFMLVRQPLISNLATFRRREYIMQRERWGHIGYFDYRSFLDMSLACGFKPLKIELKAPWELIAKNPNCRGWISQKLLTKLHRELASWIMGGFYLNGAFVRE